MTDYRMIAKVIDGDAFEVPFIGFEDLGDVLAEIEALSLLGASPAFQPISRYEALWVYAVDMTEFCVMCRD